MNKHEQVEKLLAKPIVVGDEVDVRIAYKTTSTNQVKRKVVSETVDKVKTGGGKVVEIVKDPKYGIIYVVQDNSSSWSVPHEAKITPTVKIKNTAYGNNVCLAEWVTIDTSSCGSNPFRPFVRISFNNQNIWQLMHNAGYGRYNENYNAPQYQTITGNSPGDAGLVGCTYGGVNFDPYVIDENGEKQYYQRSLVWTEHQKQLLIESIYNGIEIGKFLFRYRSWDSMRVQMKETGHAYNFDCVDGKQRMHAIIDFIAGRFKDLHGNYFSELSNYSQRKFFDYSHLAMGTLPEDATDKDVIAAFLTLNFTGAPMSAEHIAHVQSIRV